jgi:hypothetical protein
MNVRTIGTVFGLLVCVCAGCSNKPPISTTLTDLIAESNDYNVDPFIDFHENVSINGLLLQPQPGAHWYTARPGMLDQLRGRKRSSPAFAIGISSRLGEPTFYLSGKTSDVDIKVVNSVKKSIETIQARTAEAVTLTADLAAARAALKANATDKQLSADKAAAQKKELEERIKQFEDAKKEVDKKLTGELETYRNAIADNPGLVVARWTVRKSSATSAKTSVFDASHSSSDTTSGYLVLGGMRVSALYFGDDLRTYVSILLPSEEKLFDALGITTYLIQTKALAYTNALDLQQALSASLSAKLSSLGDINDLLTDMDKLTISTYFATAMNLDNTGSLSGATWTVRRRPMVEYSEAKGDDLLELQERYKEKHQGKPMPNHLIWARVRPTGAFQLAEESPAAAPASQERKLVDGEWYTVVAVSADAPKVYKQLRALAKGKGLPRFDNIDERSYMLMDKQSFDERTNAGAKTP